MGAAQERPSRRMFLRLGATSVAATAIASCDLSTAPEGGRDETGGTGAKEAPMLAKQVKEGTLPPVEERLPKDPLVVEPTERIGKYGGQWDTFLTSVDADPHLIGCLSYEPLVRWNIDSTELSPVSRWSGN